MSQSDQDDIRQAWNRNAAWWQQRQGSDDADVCHQHIIFPATEQLLVIGPGARVLDIACGTGNLSRRLARSGARVVGWDISERLIAYARSQTPPELHVQYQCLDATDPAALAAALDHGDGPTSFDAAVCSMALHDMADIDDLLAALPRLLTPAGRFVFSITHPCFNHTGVTVVHEQSLAAEDDTSWALRVNDYPANRRVAGWVAPGQPHPVPQFERSLTELFRSCFSAGLVLDALIEPLAPPTLAKISPEFAQLWSRIPLFLLTRWRLAPPASA